MALTLKSVLQITVCAAILQLFIPDNKPAEVYLWSGFHVNIESVVKPLHKETPYWLQNSRHGNSTVTMKQHNVACECSSSLLSWQPELVYVCMFFKKSS